jgi:hypothetical protein
MRDSGAVIRTKVAATSRGALLPGPSYLGACDASAVVELGGTRFAVASDEPCSDGSQVLHVYERDYPRPLATVSLADVAGDRAHREMDLEAGVRVDDRIYWVSSHGHDGDGRRDRARCAFFATDLRAGRLEPQGAAYRRLLDDMAAAEELAPLRLRELDRRRIAPKQGGLNIEGMTARPDGAVLLGLRSPLHERRAVLVPFLNPDAVLEGRERARFDPPITLDLQGNGIRDVAWDAGRRIYVVLGGASGRGHGRALYVWSGRDGEEPVPVDAMVPADFNAEAVLVDAATGRVRVFSDDGARVLESGGGKRRANKDLKDSRRSFRSLWLLLE